MASTIDDTGFELAPSMTPKGVAPSSGQPPGINPHGELTSPAPFHRRLGELAIAMPAGSSGEDDSGAGRGGKQSQGGPVKPYLFTVAEAAVFLNVSKSTMGRMAAAGEVPTLLLRVRAGKRTFRFREDALKQWLARQEQVYARAIQRKSDQGKR